MPNLIPVDHDPFATPIPDDSSIQVSGTPPSPMLAPTVVGAESGDQPDNSNNPPQNSAPSLKAVDYDPFTSTPQAQSASNASDLDSAGKAFKENMLPQILATAIPYGADKVNLTRNAQLKDAAESGASGAAQSITSMVTLPIDALRYGKAAVQNAGEYLGTEAANAVLPGTDQKPDISWPNSLTGAVDKKLDYTPKTAAGQRLKFVASLAGPVVAGKVIGAAGDAVTAAEAERMAVASGSQVTAPQLRDIAGRVFNKADDLGGAIPAEGTNAFLDSIKGAANQTEAGKVFSGENEFSTLSQRVESLRDKPLSFAETSEIDRDLTNRINDAVLPNGKLSTEGQKYTAMQAALRDAMLKPIEGEGEGFAVRKQAQSLWQQQAAMNDIDSIIERAKYTDNPVTALKTGFKNLVTNPVKMRNFKDPAEIAALQRAAKTGLSTEIMKTFGSRLIPIMSTATGGLLDIAGAEAGSLALRGAANAQQMQRATAARDIIGRRNELPILEKPYSAPETPPTPPGLARPKDTYYNPKDAPSGPVPEIFVPGSKKTVPYGYPQKRGGPVFAKPKSYPALKNGKFADGGATDAMYDPSAFQVASDGLVDSSLMGLGSVAAGMGTSAADAVKSVATGQPYHPIDSYKQGVEANRQYLDKGAERHPKEAELGEEMGFLGPFGKGKKAVTKMIELTAHARGGAINMKKGGAVFKKPIEYPALKNKKART